MTKKLSLKDAIRVGFGAALIVSSGCTDHGSITKSDISETTLPRTTPAIERFAFEGAKFVAGKGVTVSEGQKVSDLVDTISESNDGIFTLVRNGKPAVGSGEEVAVEGDSLNNGWAFEDIESSAVLGAVEVNSDEIIIESEAWVGADAEVILQRKKNDPKAFINVDSKNTTFLVRNGILVPSEDQFKNVPKYSRSGEWAHAEFDPASRDFEGVVTVSPEGNVAVMTFEALAITS